MPPPILRSDFRLDTLIETYDLDLLVQSSRRYTVASTTGAPRLVSEWRYDPRPDTDLTAGVTVECWLSLDFDRPLAGQGWIIGRWPQSMQCRVSTGEGAVIIQDTRIVGFTPDGPSPAFLATLSGPEQVEQRARIETDGSFQSAVFEVPTDGQGRPIPEPTDRSALAYVQVVLSAEVPSAALQNGLISLDLSAPSYEPVLTNRRRLWAQVQDDVTSATDPTGRPGYRLVDTTRTVQLVTRVRIAASKIVQLDGVNWQVASNQALGRTGFYEATLQRADSRTWYV